MEEILGNVYCLLESLYGKALSDYLWGYDCNTQDYTLELHYNQFGVIALFSALIIPPIYYYLWNPFRFAKKKKGKQKVLSLQKVNQRREVNYCGI